MNPIKFNAGALRRLCLSASSDLLHRPHLCALRFRPSDVVATNGAMLVRAPLPHDTERDFVLPAFPVARLIGKHRHRTVTVKRCERETRVEIEGGETFIVPDNPEISVDRYPPVDRVIDETQDAGAAADICLSAQMWTRIGKLARDLYPAGPLDEDTEDDFGCRLATDAPVTVIKAGSLPKAHPAHLTVKAHHGDALIVAMPVKR